MLILSSIGALGVGVDSDPWQKQKDDNNCENLYFYSEEEGSRAIKETTFFNQEPAGPPHALELLFGWVGNRRVEPDGDITYKAILVHRIVLPPAAPGAGYYGFWYEDDDIRLKQSDFIGKLGPQRCFGIMNVYYE